MIRWLPVVLAIALVVGASLIFSGDDAAWPSVANTGPSGYHVASRYLTEHGRDVRVWTEPLDTLPADATLVLALPALVDPDDAEATTLLQWARGGGHFVLLPSPSGPVPPSLESALRLDLLEVNRKPPLSYFEWKDWYLARTRLQGAGGTLITADAAWRVVCPPGAEPLYRTTEGEAAVCRWGIGAGSITVVPDSTVFTSARLPLGDNLALLEELLPAGRPVCFDERGFSVAAAAVDEEHARGVEALVAQLGFVYIAAIFAVARAFGPGRRSQTEGASSLARDVRVLGRLHAAGGHVHDAGNALLTMARARFPADPGLAARREFTGGADAFVALARQVTELERRGG
jgi:hypothetical protein